MLFYRVKNPNDLQVQNTISNWLFVNKELYTQKELNRIKLPEVVQYFDSAECKHKTIKAKDIFEVVEISKFNTHFFFGCRFEDK